MSESDVGLVARVAAGDEEALFELHRQYVNLVFSMALRVLSSPAEAEEITQEVFLTIWRRAESYDPARGSVATWLLTISRRRAIDRLRRRNRRPPVTEFLERVGEEAAAPAPPLHVDLREALLSLPARQRAIIELIYFGGYTYREVAEALELPLGTVKSRVRLAMEKLRRALLVLLTVG
ncbi:MAG: sigma-70 family RNA polymerase sigma factor [Chloroflexota bacterium]|nr:sigma-70 family RNA polymerase sigma factor [Chloroflexota bacterium]